MVQTSVLVTASVATVATALLGMLTTRFLFHLSTPCLATANTIHFPSEQLMQLTSTSNDGETRSSAAT